MEIQFLSKEESMKGGGFSKDALVADDYICKVIDIDTNAISQTYESVKLRGWKNDEEVAKLAEEVPDAVQNVVRIKMLVYGLKSGDPLVDVNGQSVKPLERLIIKDVKPFGGFSKKDGSPSDYRMFFASALRQDAMKPFAVSGISEVVGKYIAIELAVTEKGKNSPKKFKRVPDSFKADADVEKAGLEAYDESQKRLKEWKATQLLNSMDVNNSFEDKAF